MACRCLLDHRPGGRRPLSNHRRTRTLGSALSASARLGSSAMEGQRLGSVGVKVCRDCAEEYPIDHFRQTSKWRKRGFVERSICIGCHRRQDRENKRRLNGDPAYLAYRREYLVRRKSSGQPLPSRAIKISRRNWVWRQAEQWLPLYRDQTVVVYTVPNPTAREYERNVPDKPWIGRCWAIRVARPGMTPPPFSVPLCAIENGIVRPHPSTPDGWRWVTGHVDRWLRRRRQNGTETNNETNI